jgi:hypothetical protein
MPPLPLLTTTLSLTVALTVPLVKFGAAIKELRHGTATSHVAVCVSI